MDLETLLLLCFFTVSTFPYVSSKALMPTLLQVDITALEDVEFTSPGYEMGHYPELSDYKWDISAAQSQNIQVLFEEFDVEFHDDCVGDSVTIYNGSCENNAKSEVTKLCGVKNNYQVLSKNNLLCVSFVSDQVNNRRGFKAIATINTEIQETTNAENSDPKDNSENTTKLLPYYSTPSSIVPSSSNLETTAPQFIFPNSTIPSASHSLASRSSSCSPSSQSTSQTKVSSSQPSLTSVSSPLTLTTTPLTSNHNVHSPLAALPTSNISTVGKSTTTTTTTTTTTATTTEHTSTDGQGTAVVDIKMCESGRNETTIAENTPITLRSPADESGKFYPLDKHCQFTVYNPNELNLKIEFLQFQLEDQSSCLWDYVVLYTPQSSGRLCGSTTPGTIKTTSSYIDVVFRSDQMVADVGFEMKIQPHIGKTSTTQSIKLATHSDVNHTQTPTTTIMSKSSVPPSVSTTGILKSTTDAHTIQEYNVSNVSTLTHPSATTPVLSTEKTSQSSSKTSTEIPLTLPFKSSTASNTDKMSSGESSTTLSVAAIKSNSKSSDKSLHSNLNVSFTTTSSTSTLSTGEYTATTPSLVASSPSISSTKTPIAQTTKSTSENITSKKELRKNNSQIFDICKTEIKEIEITNTATVVSPGYLENNTYPLGIECSITVTSPQQTEILMQLENFNLEMHPTCLWDYLRVQNDTMTMKLCGDLSIYKANEYTNCLTDTLIAYDELKETRLCGFNETRPLGLRKQNTVTFTFVSDHIIPGKGFNITLLVNSRHVPETTPRVNAALSTLSTVFSATTAKPSYESSVTNIPATADSNVNDVTHFNSESSTQQLTYTTNDYYPASTLVSKFISTITKLASKSNVGSTPETTKKSKTDETNTQSIDPSTTTPTLSADESTTIHAEQTSADSQQMFDICANGSLFVTDQISLVTPGYKDNQNYGLTIVCNIQVASPPQTELFITLDYFNLEFNYICSWDSLLIEYADTSLKLCGYLKQTQDPNESTDCMMFNTEMICDFNDITTFSLSKNNRVSFTFTSDSVIAKKGFHLTIYAKQLSPENKDSHSSDQVSESKQENQQSQTYPTTMAATTKTHVSTTVSTTPSVLLSSTKPTSHESKQDNQQTQTYPTTPDTTKKNVSTTASTTPSVLLSSIKSSLHESKQKKQKSQIYLTTSATTKKTITTNTAETISVHLSSTKTSLHESEKGSIESENNPTIPTKTDKTKFISTTSSVFLSSLKTSAHESRKETQRSYNYKTISASTEKTVSNTDDSTSSSIKIFSFESTFSPKFSNSSSKQSTIRSKTESSSFQPVTDNIPSGTHPLKTNSISAHSTTKSVEIRSPEVSKMTSHFHSSTSASPTMKSTTSPVKSAQSSYLDSEPTSPSESFNEHSPTAPSSNSSVSKACGNDGVPETITRWSGYIESPGYSSGSNYPPGLACKWKIENEKDKVIIIQFSNTIDIEYSPNCKWDKLAIYEEVNKGADLIELKTLCGNLLPGTVTSPNNVIIEFTTDQITQHRGFKLEYINADTGGEIPESTSNTCPPAMTPCLSSATCIPMEWRCDGENDCSEGTDEKHCPVCASNEFACGKGLCLPISSRCNGVVDCAYGLDEAGCVSLPNDDSGQLSSVGVEISNTVLPLCYKDDVMMHADRICQVIGYRTSERIWSNHVKYQEYATMTVGEQSNLQFSASGVCPDENVTHLECNGQDCGLKHDSIRHKRIIGGSQISKGEWPWLVALKIGTTVVCGGTVIDEMWVLTAGHCVQDLVYNPQVGTIIAGISDINDKSQQVRYITDVVLHPDQFFIYNADIALLKLQRPLVFNSNVKQICLPWDKRRFSPASRCYVAGWGVSDMQYYYTTIAPSFLRHVKMKIVNTDVCRDVYSNKREIKDTMLCAGYSSGGIDACRGDSGGGLMCETDDGRWVQAGIVSWGDMCGSTNKPGVYTKVSSFVDWIDTTLGKKGTQSTNCTFETGDWCGYTGSANISYVWTRKPAGIGSVGNIMYATRTISSGDDPATATLVSPEFKSAVDSCLSFSFMFSGNSNITFSVYGERGDQPDDEETLLWRITSNYPTKDTWKVTEMNVPHNVKKTKFVSYHEKSGISGVGLDNVILTQLPCQGSTFMKCKFNDGTTCQYSNTHAYGSKEWTIKHRDKTKNDYMLQTGGNSKEFGYMAIARLLSPALTYTFTALPHCVLFSFNKNTSSSSQLKVATYVSMGDNLGNQQVLWSSEGATIGEWTTVKVDILNGYFNYIVFEVRRSYFNTDIIDIQLDDISISDGNCT